MKTLLALLQSSLLLMFIGGSVHAQSKLPKQFSLQGQSQTTPLPPSNSVSHIVTRGLTLWAGTGKGLARTLNGGRSWEQFRTVPQFVNEGIFSIAVRGDTIWASTGFDKKLDDGSIPTGSGYTYSLDNGTTWTHTPQTLDAQSDSVVNYDFNIIKFLPVTVYEANVTYDVAFSSSFVWIASWSSGLRRSSNMGQTWQRVVLPSFDRNSVAPTDTLTGYRVNPVPDDNFKVFSVFVQDDSTIWAGSAGGINKSTDGGVSWAKFTVNNQTAPILGNWVIAISGQRFGSTQRVWTTNWRAAGVTEQFGISYTDDGGRIWHNFLHGVRAYEFAFKDSITYVASDDGIYRTSDGGNSWQRSGTIIGADGEQRITSQAFFSVGVIGDTVYGGSGDGIVKTIDNASHPFGMTWEVVRAYVPVGPSADTYAYPNPFSPDEEVIRFHYGTGGAPATVTIEVFDFGMNRVRTVIKEAQRSGSEHDEIWNGQDDNNTQVANGVYFYRVTINKGHPIWGKIMVLQ
jgi:hypothetical protein